MAIKKRKLKILYPLPKTEYLERGQKFSLNQSFDDDDSSGKEKTYDLEGKTMAAEEILARPDFEREKIEFLAQMENTTDTIEHHGIFSVEELESKEGKVLESVYNALKSDGTITKKELAELENIDELLENADIAINKWSGDAIILATDDGIEIKGIKFQPKGRER